MHPRVAITLSLIALLLGGCQGVLSGGWDTAAREDVLVSMDDLGPTVKSSLESVVWSYGLPATRLLADGRLVYTRADGVVWERQLPEAEVAAILKQLSSLRATPLAESYQVGDPAQGGYISTRVWLAVDGGREVSVYRHRGDDWTTWSPSVPDGLVAIAKAVDLLAVGGERYQASSIRLAARHFTRGDKLPDDVREWPLPRVDLQQLADYTVTAGLPAPELRDDVLVYDLNALLQGATTATGAWRQGGKLYWVSLAPGLPTPPER